MEALVQSETQRRSAPYRSSCLGNTEYHSVIRKEHAVYNVVLKRGIIGILRPKTLTNLKIVGL